MKEEVGALEGKIGINNAYRKYKNFLYLKFDSSKEHNNVLQLTLIDPENFEEPFIAETLYDLVWAGVYDSNTFNPLFNEFIHYIEKNSGSYRRLPLTDPKKQLHTTRLSCCTLTPNISVLN